MWCCFAVCFGMGNDLLINGFSLPLLTNKLNFWQVNWEVFGAGSIFARYSATWTNEFKKCFFGSLGPGKTRKVSVFEAESFHRLWPDRSRCLRTSPPYRRWKAPYRLPFCRGSLRL